MRILSVQETDWFNRGPHQQHHLLERLAERGHEIRVIHYPLLWRQQLGNGSLGHPSVTEGVTRVTMGPGVTVVTPPFLPVRLLDLGSMASSHFLSIRTQLRVFKPDIVLGYSILNSHLAMIMARKSGIPFVYHIIDLLYELIPWPLMRGVGKLLEERNLRGADLVIGINQTLLEMAVNRGADSERCRLVRAGVDLERYGRRLNNEQLRQGLGIGDADLILGYMGWVYPFSGLTEILPSIVRAKRDGTRVVLLVIGDGEAVSRLLSVAGSLGVRENVILTGWQSYDLLPSYLNVCDMFLFPALKSNIVNHIVPIKFYEYLAAGKPVIATRLLGLVKEFDSCDAVHFVNQTEDVVSLALKLIADVSQYNRDKGTARSFVEANCDWARLTQQFQSYLEDAIVLRGVPS